MDYDRLRELQTKFDENPRRYFAPLANEYRKGGQPKRAIEICRAHLAQMPGHMSGQIVYGQALFEAGEWEEAKTVFERALTLDPENLIALRSLGDMSLQAGDTSEARTWYTRLLDADPKDPAVIALMSEIDEEGAADPEETQPEAAMSAPAPVALEEVEATPAVLESEAVPAVSESEAVPAVSESEAVPDVQEPAGLERHYPIETVEAVEMLETVEEAVPSSSAVAETAGAIEDVTSAKEDVPGALDSLSPSDTAPPEEPATPAAAQLAEEESLEEARVRAAAEAPSVREPEPPPAAEPARAPEPFVNETMAQLYLQQGYRQLALSVYRQLSASRPQDQSLKDRIAEIEAADAADHPSEVPMMRREERIDAPATSPSRDRASIEAATRDEPRAEPEVIAAREPSIREFFATLGRRRPPRATGTSGIRSPNRAPEPAPSLGSPVPGATLDSVFAGATVSPSDARAASRLAGAFSATTGAAGGTRTPPTPPMPTPRLNPRVQQPQESEEDVAKFRAWLDGLTRE
ncbi:MAG TPA: tetratricopeptide repeat protein [Gemmatimonadaceae bacterium]|nr:tetratricopeptide repeat protein [Gemmatimonadaceae bacterium]